MPNKNNLSHLNDHLRFLIDCCKKNLSKEETACIHAYLNNPLLDTHSLIGLANQHGILPLVYKSIKHQIPMTNHEIVSAFKQQYLSIAQRNMLMSAELIHIMKLLEANDIEALAFKGPVLAQMAYGDITLRQYGDLDILVDEKEVSKAGSILAEHGYSPVFPITILKNKTCLEVTNDLGFHNETNGILIELHWKLFREKIGQHLHFLHIGENQQSVKINGKMIPTLSIEMLLGLSLPSWFKTCMGKSGMDL